MATAKIPEGFQTITPSLLVEGAAKAIDLYKNAFGATEVHKMLCPETGKVMHACLQIGNSKLFLADTSKDMECGTPNQSSFYLYLENVDDAHKKATQAGMKEKFPVQDMFWGDRTGSVIDPFGNIWTLATHVRDVSPAEMEEGRKNFGKKAAA